jgi:hypothetical protein
MMRQSMSREGDEPVPTGLARATRRERATK